MRRLLGFTVTIISAAAVAGCGGSGVSSIELANDLVVLAHAVNCTDFGGERRGVDNSKARLYTCVMHGGKQICVTYQNGIARNVTAEARILWATALSGGKLGCLNA